MLIFFQPFNRFNSFREIAFYGLLLLFILKIFKDRAIHIDFRDKTIVAISLLVGWSILASILGPYPLDSLNALRKNLFVQMLIFLVIITEFKSYNELRTLFRIVAVSFAVVTLLAVIEYSSKDWTNFHQWTRTHKMFIGGYANNATFYLPFIAAWLIAIKKPLLEKWIGTITVSLGLIVAFIYNSRTALIAIPVAIFIVLFLSKRYKLLIVGFMIYILLLMGMFLSDSSTFSKYKSLSKQETYYTNQGFGGRFAVWQGALHIIRERPLTGYGYGWKKIALVARDLNLEEYWKEQYPHVYAYYVNEANLSYGRVSPHNLILQVMFEIGIIGLAVLTWVWSTLIYKIYHAFRTANRGEAKNFIVYSSGVVFSYFLINITNGFWHETYGNMIFFFFAALVVLNESPKK
jgi:O-antigen ligase